MVCLSPVGYGATGNKHTISTFVDQTHIQLVSICQCTVFCNIHFLVFINIEIRLRCFSKK